MWCMSRDLDFHEDYVDSHHFFSMTCDELSKEDLYRMVYHDNITGYYNWNHLWKILDPNVQKDFKYCFVHFDIKDFKMINDLYGHGIGNGVLRIVAQNIERQPWVLHGCRCDNDNFAMMVEAADEEEIFARLRTFFEEISVLPCDRNYKLFYRCGVVVSEDAISNGDTVADLAKIAQHQGIKPNCTEINFFNNEMYVQTVSERRYLAYLDTAIERDEFVVYLQPKYDIHTEKIVGAEALVRWNYKFKKLLFPGEFVGIFEENYVIGKVDQVVLEKVCKFLKYCIDNGLKLLPISVNLSRTRMENKSLKQQILQTVDSYGIPHNLIEFELTESSAYADLESMYFLLSDLRDHGFSISMDDFGTGYSSLSLLKDMPMDTLKVDKCFVDSILTSKEDSKERILLKEIILLSKRMGFSCIAEGAEHKEQVDLLRMYGCDKIQGYYYSKPLQMEEYLKRLSSAEA